MSRKEGDLEAGWVVEALETDYHRRYGDRDALYPVAVRDQGRVAHAAVVDPKDFFEYLHALKTLSSVEVRHVSSRRGKNLGGRMIES